MQILITGGAGFLGQKLAQTLLARGQIIGPDGHETPIEKLVIFDTNPSRLTGDSRLEIAHGDITDLQVVRALVTGEISLIFHLATVVERILWQPDPFIEKIIYSWPVNFAPLRAMAMGFKADNSMREIIRAFIEDELNGQFVA